jgi:tetratricopeptide (TPR) repeat protein
VLTDHRYRRGNWDEAHRDADNFLAGVEAGRTHALAFQVFALRAELRLAKDDVAGAMADAERALAAGRANAEVQATSFTLASCAHVFALASHTERAAVLAHELLESLRRGVRMQFAVINLPAFASAAVRLGLRGELVDALAGYPESRWTEAVAAYLAGDFAAAAEILDQAGGKPDAAEARLRAAEQLAALGRRDEADEQLERALAFWRSVGATRYIREAESLLTASA